MNTALGFDSFVVMRHGQEGQKNRLGCYFCNDIVAPVDVCSVNGRGDRMNISLIYPSSFTTHSAPITADTSPCFPPVEYEKPDPGSAVHCDATRLGGH